MDRPNYDRILKVIEEKTLSELLSFLRSLPLFNDWTNTALTKLKYFFVPRTYVRGSIVYNEGEPSGKVYIIRSGDFEENCKVSLNNGIDDEDCLPILSEEKKKFCTFRANFTAKYLTQIPIYTRRANVTYI